MGIFEFEIQFFSVFHFEEYLSYFLLGWTPKAASKKYYIRERVETLRERRSYCQQSTFDEKLRFDDENEAALK